MPSTKGRSVVVTGVGAVSALGIGAEALWEGLCAGTSGVRPITRFDASGFASRLAGEVPEPGLVIRDFVPKHYRKATKVMARDIELAVAAAKEASERAGLTTRAHLEEGATEGTTYPTGRVGCHIGAGLIAADSDELGAALATAVVDQRVDLATWGRTGMDNLTPLWMLKYLPNMLACHVTIIHGCEGPSNTITCAEASGLLCIGESTRVIERGDAEACFAGSAECKVNLMGLLRMQLAGRAGPTGDHADGRTFVRPFDLHAPGGVVGEGGGIVVLESEQSARARGRGEAIIARIAGIGAGHSPRPPAGQTIADASGDDGFLAAIENATRDAGLTPGDIDAVVVLGTGVPSVDSGEGGALRTFFGGRTPPVVTIGPNVGNCAAGSGGLLAIVGALMIHRQMIPARLHASTPMPGIDAGPAPARAATLRHVLVASSSLGGQNAAVVMGR
jgi:3-oxoacyl-[acyl-carrier-protein] synthase II